jgi:seryl-tRNA synthetase
LLQGFVDLFGGDENLIGLRSRVGQFRPLSVVMDMQARAQQSYLGEIQKLEQTLGQAQQRINELQKAKGEGQQFILSPEQKTELEKFRTEQAETKRRLKDLRKTLRAETDQLETRTKLLNIVAMPLAVALIGLGLAWYQRKRVAAR